MCPPRWFGDRLSGRRRLPAVLLLLGSDPYHPGHAREEALEIVRRAILDSGCVEVIIGGFSNGATFAGTPFCRGENIDGRVVGVVVDDPPPDEGTIGCRPSAGTRVVLYWTTALDEVAAPGTDCDGIGWTCLGGDLSELRPTQLRSVQLLFESVQPTPVVSSRTRIRTMVEVSYG